MDIEREIELLKEKLALLEKIRELQDAIKTKECTQITPCIPYIPQPIYPVYPPVYPWIYYTLTTGSAYGGTPNHCVSSS